IASHGSQVTQINHSNSVSLSSSSPIQPNRSGKEREKTPAPHNLTIVQRQRIGNSFARVTGVSIGPELRFRIEAAPRVAPKCSEGGSPLRSPQSAVRTHYVPLNVHSYYSFLDSTLSTRAVVELAKRYELPAIALTDKNNLHGAVEFAHL